MNVLLTAAGRRTYLVRYFQAALRGRGIVVAANSTPDAPALTVADEAAVVPPSYHPEYFEAISEVCRRFDIRLLNSCHDLDVLALAPHRDSLRTAGVIAMLPDEDWAMLCLDKFACGEKLRRAGFSAPWATLSLDEAIAALSRGEVKFPMIVKARLGFGSLALHKCHSLEHLRWSYESSLIEMTEDISDRFFPLPRSERIIIQEFVQGSERRLNIVNDLSGDYSTHFIVDVHEMRAGESDSGTTIDRDTFGDLPYRFSSLTKHIGIWGIDVLADESEVQIIDINPRFAGEYPFFHLAGADIPAAMIAWALGEEPKSAWLNPTTGVSGYKDLVPVRLLGMRAQGSST